MTSPWARNLSDADRAQHLFQTCQAAKRLIALVFDKVQIQVQKEIDNGNLTAGRWQPGLPYSYASSEKTKKYGPAADGDYEAYQH